MSGPRLRQIIYDWRVRVGTPILIAVVVLSKPTWIFLLSGLVVCFLGLLLRTWAAGHLLKEKELTVSGPYKYTRNPLYLANLLIGLGIVMAARSLWVFLIFGVYFLLFYPAIIFEEKERMERLFPEKYEAYRKRVPLFLPSWKPLRTPEIKSFDWSLYVKNKEFRAPLAAVLFWLILAAKLLFFR